MQAEPAHGGTKRIGGVQVVAQDWMPDRFEVKSELMTAPGQRGELESGDGHPRIGVGRRERIVEIADLTAAGHDPLRQAGFPAFEVDHLSWRVIEVLPEWKIDLARIFVRMSTNQRVIGLFSLSVLELSAQFSVCFGIATHHDDAAGVSIEPMHDAGLRIRHIHPTGETIRLFRADAGYGE